MAALLFDVTLHASRLPVMQTTRRMHKGDIMKVRKLTSYRNKNRTCYCQRGFDWLADDLALASPMFAVPNSSRRIVQNAGS
jgi:hypothetical protein